MSRLITGRRSAVALTIAVTTATIGLGLSGVASAAPTTPTVDATCVDHTLQISFNMTAPELVAAGYQIGFNLYTAKGVDLNQSRSGPAVEVQGGLTATDGAPIPVVTGDKFEGQFYTNDSGGNPVFIGSSPTSIVLNCDTTPTPTDTPTTTPTTEPTSTPTTKPTSTPTPEPTTTPVPVVTPKVVTPVTPTPTAPVTHVVGHTA